MTLPRTVREAFGLQEGDWVAFIRKGKHIMLQSVAKSLLDMKGVVPVAEKQDFGKIRQAVRTKHFGRYVSLEVKAPD